MPNKNSGKTNRREVLKGAAGAGFLATFGHRSEATEGRSNSIVEENRKPGTTDWQITYTRVDPSTKFRSPWIEGYVSHASIAPGETLHLFVSTNPEGPFKVDFYRLGYYGGSGGRHLMTSGPLKGRVQPDPPIGEKRLRDCQWEPSLSFAIPEDWISGVYLGKLSLLEDRYQSYVIFIVREDREAEVLFQCSDNTWQAYNRWPSQFALYDDGNSQWALNDKSQVSFNRPYGKYCQILDAPLSQGSGEFLLWEFPLAYWLEKEGYDVTYLSNTDIHRSKDCLRKGKILLSVGHDEYWSLQQYAHVKEAIDSGLNVAFLSGNTCCFVAPYSSDTKGVPNRVITRAGRYGGLVDAEKERMGPFHLDGPNEALLIGARTIVPFNGSGDWIVTDDTAWIFEGTGMKNGDRVPGLVGWEFHGDPANIPGLQVVAGGTTTNAGDEKADWTATLYPGPKGNFVFNASTIWWSQGLSDPPGHILPYSHYGRPHGVDERVQRITKNLLDRALG
ncbi:MAG: hypothetical protein KC994_01960 [Candidatus Omnitrophica bacterium]|nr:hypothetical protein [Candidatus Omnitrophota bacterium]